MGNVMKNKILNIIVNDAKPKLLGDEARLRWYTGLTTPRNDVDRLKKKIQTKYPNVNLKVIHTTEAEHIKF